MISEGPNGDGGCTSRLPWDRQISSRHSSSEARCFLRMLAGWLTVSGRSADVDCGWSSANISRRAVLGRDLRGVVGLAAGLAPSCRGLCVPAKCLAVTTLPMQAAHGIPGTSVDNERTSCTVDCDNDVRSRSCRCFRRSTAESICLRYRRPPSWPSNTACGIWARFVDHVSHW